MPGRFSVERRRSSPTSEAGGSGILDVTPQAYRLALPGVTV
jgi:hypothetical protein